MVTKHTVPSCRHRHAFSSEIQLGSGNERIISCFGGGSWQAGLSWHCRPEELNVHSCVAAVSQERACGDHAVQDAMQVPQGSGLAWDFTRHHAPLCFTDDGRTPKASLDLRGGPDPPSWQEECQIIRDILKTALSSSEILKRVWHIKTYHCLSCDLISLSIYKCHLNVHSYYPDAMSKLVCQVR